MKLFIDTDIGDDWDDIAALALACASPEVELVGVATVAGDVALRARLARRFLAAAGRPETPVAEGEPTQVRAAFSHRRWAEAGPPPPAGAPGATRLLLEAARLHAGELTVLAIGPLSNLAAALRADPAAFARIGRIVAMGGSIRRGYRDLTPLPATGPSAEYNIVCDIAAARAVLGAGVPLTLAPLDATMAPLDELKRQRLFTRSTPVSDALALTWLQWSALTGRQTPILFDAVTLAAAIDPEIAGAEPMRIEVDGEGFTRPVAGDPNATVLTELDEAAFFRLALPRLLGA